MYNLIQIQDAIKGLPIQDVMKYANGQNPDVPAYLALAELNRRKQLQDTATSFYGEPQTVKEQIESSLTKAPAGQVNPTVAPQTASPTVPPQLQTLTAPPPKPASAIPQQVNPAAAPAVPPMMAKGGLASLPVGMFKRSNYAGGGIIAFDGGGFTEEERRKQMEEDQASLKSGLKSIGSAAMDILTLPQRAAAGIINQGIRGARAVTGADIPYLYQDNPEMVDSMTPYYDKNVRKPEIEKAKTDKEAKDLEAFDEATKRFEEERAAAGKKPNQQASSTSSGQMRTPAAPAFKAATPSSQDLTDEQLFERRRKLQELAGVSQDPYAEARKRYADIEARQKAQAEEDPMNALRTMLRGYAQASPTDRFGVQLAAGAEKMAAFDKETAALRDSQAKTMADLQLNMAKEEDARKRGDVTAIEAARAAQEKNKLDLAKLEVERMTAQAHMISATRPAAEIQMIERIAKDKGLSFADAAEYMQGLKGMNALRTAADKEWNESMVLREEWAAKGGYPAYMASKGLSVAGGAPQSSAPKEGDKSTSKSGKPIIFRNGKWEYE